MKNFIAEEGELNREQERIRKNLEKNPVAECNKIQKKYYPMLFEKFAGVTDPRHKAISNIQQRRCWERCTINVLAELRVCVR